ncbi:hypothetical protein [Sphingomonas sp. RS2018]
MKKLLPAIAALTLLTACGGGNDDAPPPVDNGEELLDVTNEAVGVPEAPLPEAMNIPEPANIAEETPPPTPPEQQVQEDADATGMTARVDRSAQTDEPAQPVEAQVSEEKKQ